MSENELDYVFLGCSDADPQPDPAEVAAVRWVLPSELEAEIEEAPDRFSPWLPDVLATLTSNLGQDPVYRAGRPVGQTTDP